MGIRFGVLGPLQVECDGQLLSIAGPKVRMLLAGFLCAPGETVRVDALVDLMWHGAPPRTAVASLHNHVNRLRTVLCRYGARLRSVPNGYLLVVEPDELDLLAFAGAAERVRDAHEREDWAAVAAEAEGALALWRGEPFADVPALAACPQATRLREARLALLERVFAAGLHSGRHHELVAELTALTTEHPLHETFHAQLMLALHGCGRTAQALDVHRELRNRLAEELGVDPGGPVREAHQHILASDGEPEPPIPRAPSARSAARASQTTPPPVASLPRDIPAFIGRREELDLVLAACRRGAEAGGVLGIHAVDGMPGIGKSAFAVHCAHRLASDFPDGQIFLPLHAHTPGTRVVGPAEALAALLLAVGVAPQEIPSELSARAGMWRSRVAGKKILLLLDDALGSEQVRPLLPAAPGTLVMVTSRRRMVGLEDSVPITLDVLPPREAAELFTAKVGRAGLLPEDPSVVEMVRLCGYLPLAVQLLAARLRHHPSWSVADLVSDLGDATGRLDAICAGTTSVAAVFDLSYRHLPTDLKRLFRRLGLHPGDDLDAYAAAALDDTDLPTARRRLEVLEDHHLIDEPVRGRYRMHDLLREHARELAGADRPEERVTALDRLLDYYLAGSTAANRHFARHSQPATSHAPSAISPDLSTPERATAWMLTERANLHAAVELAAAHDRPLHAVRLPSALHEILRGQGHWEQAETLHQIALDTATVTGDRLGQADALVYLAKLRDLRGQLEPATELLRQALTLYRALGERLGEAYTHFCLGDVQQSEGRYEAAIDSCRAALAIYQEAGDLPGQANALVRLAFVQQLAGHTDQATENLPPALDLFRTLGDRVGLGNVHFNLGLIGEKTGRYEDAARNHDASISQFRAMGNRFCQANAHQGLGLAQEAMGRYEEAAENHRAALEILRAMGNPIGHANSLALLARVQLVTGQHEVAADNLRAALEMYRTAGIRRGELDALVTLGSLQHETGHHAEAVELLQQALTGFRAIGVPAAEARALVHLGDAQRATGELDAAAESLRRGLALCGDLQDPGIETETLNALGRLLSERGRWVEARAHHTRALEVARAISYPLQEVRALEGIADSFGREGNTCEREAHLRRALTIAERLALPDVESVRNM